MACGDHSGDGSVLNRQEGVSFQPTLTPSARRNQLTSRELSGCEALTELMTRADVPPFGERSTQP
jgi:hypothetical protein